MSFASYVKLFRFWSSIFIRIRARWMILLCEKCHTNLPCEPNKRHLQNRARFNRACSEDLRLHRKSRYPKRVFSLCLFLFSSMMDHQRGSCNEIKFRQKRFFVGEFQRKTQKRRVFVIKRSIERFVANKWDICERKFPSNSSQSFIKLQCNQIYKRLIEARMHPVDNVYFSREIRYYETLYDRVQQRSMTSLIKSVLPTCSRFLWNIYRIK